MKLNEELKNIHGFRSVNGNIYSVFEKKTPHINALWIYFLLILNAFLLSNCNFGSFTHIFNSFTMNMIRVDAFLSVQTPKEGFQSIHPHRCKDMTFAQKSEIQQQFCPPGIYFTMGLPFKSTCLVMDL